MILSRQPVLCHTWRRTAPVASPQRWTHRHRPCVMAVAPPQVDQTGRELGEDGPTDLELLADLAEEEMGLLTVSNGDGGRGLFTLGPVQRQVVCSIPIRHSLVISDSPLNSVSIFGDRAQREWMDCHGELPKDILDFIQGEERWDVRLTAWLLYLLDNEGKIRSKSPTWAAEEAAGIWDMYLHQLPDERDMSCLLNYNQEEAHELQIERLITEAGVQHDWVSHLHDRWFSKKNSKGPRALQLAHSVKETLWASAMVRSRTFSEEVNGEGLTLMVPWADLANHSTDYNSTFAMSKDRQSFELRSIRPLSLGDEVLISYGDHKSNAELMRDYGFIVPGNPWDRIPLLPGDDLFTLESPETAKRNPNQWKNLPLLNGASLCEAADMQGDWMRGQLQAMDDVVEEMDQADWERRRCALLSLPLTDGNQGVGGACNPLGGESSDEGSGGMFGWSKSWTDTGSAPPRKLKLAEIRNERLAVAHWGKHLESLLTAMPTTVETDEELLRGKGGSKPLTTRQRAAINCRLEHKLLIQHALDLLAAYDDALSEGVTLPGRGGGKQ